MLSSPEFRKWAYVAQVVIGAALVALVAGGLVTQEFSDTLTAAVGGVLGLVLAGGGELARRNVSNAPAKITKLDVQEIKDALTERARTAAEPVMAQATPVVDHFNRAISHAEEERLSVQDIRERLRAEADRYLGR
ncbi:hypothetical protein [Rhodococcus artemisiae]|uniref:Holin n=1 Tax=Rhodococcus artemisiae TaxID=714159 RepID=A0ABU7LBR7_9NOCA|nr:hypothetical protein [Rhodococcus artemisiae]MEE2058983.1 hypothetical protein [Rhodococcus artemisiae]